MAVVTAIVALVYYKFANTLYYVSIITAGCAFRWSAWKSAITLDEQIFTYYAIPITIIICTCLQS